MEINLTAISGEVLQAKSRFGIIGNSPRLITAIQRAVQVAPIDLSVLVTGESGTGKEFFPKIIHGFSSRKHARYIAVNCGAIPEGTIDSELFGHEKGAFTGAVATRKGYFEEADGGTIFLDEVAELPLTTQARLLRVLESGEFMKVGSSTVQRTNVRIVAATNVDMAKAIAEGRFREDLYYRLSTVGIDVPPLRDRGSDTVLLTRKFVTDFVERYTMPAPDLTPDAYERLQHYRWPGNVRQLKNVVEQICLFESGNSVDDTLVESYLPGDGATYSPATTRQAGGHAPHSYADEREVLFNMVFRLQRELDSLRAVVERMAAGGEVTPEGQRMLPHKPVLPQYAASSQTAGEPITVKADEVSPAPDTEPNAVPAPEVRSLEDTERLMIERALERYDGRRKDAARELGISERTLYRKIKEYGLE